MTSRRRNRQRGMTRREGLRTLGGALGGGLLAACEPLFPDFVPPPAVLGTFPYHPLVYQLDLSILAYQLHCQSLVWPIDPFYEEHNQDGGLRREEIMTRVRTWAEQHGASQTGKNALDSYRGPGVLAGFPNNPSHDPVLYNYARLHPWSHALMNGEGRWTEYMSAREITGRIGEVFVSYRRAGGDINDVLIEPVPLARDDRDPDAADVLIAFEGGTGDKGEPNQSASQSLMGFVLLRRTGASSYDVHISFRGSRSGSAARAAFQALNTEYAGGNPDWITDLGYHQWSAVDGVGDITAIGGVHRGFARSMQSTLPTVFLALSQIAESMGPISPTNIYVTGHSLGGALAQHFASAVLLGDRYGPAGAGEAMPSQLADWPWTRLKLVTFSAPRAGDVQWAETLSTQSLESVFFDTPISPYDTEARYVTDPGIVERLHDSSRPCGFRVLVSTDPITTEKVAGGAHVGKTVYVNGDLLTGWFGLPSPEGHEPAEVRRYMTDAMADPRTPSDTWRYRDLGDFVPSRCAEQAGSIEEMQKLGVGLLRYYADRDLWFDEQAFNKDLSVLLALLS